MKKIFFSLFRYRRHWVFSWLILIGVLVLVTSIGKYRLIFTEDSTEYMYVAMLCSLLYALGRGAMAALICTDPKKTATRFNLLRNTSGVCIIFVHMWLVVFINPVQSDTQGIKVPIVLAFAGLAEFVFLSHHFKWMVGQDFFFFFSLFRLSPFTNSFFFLLSSFFFLLSVMNYYDHIPAPCDYYYDD